MYRSGSHSREDLRHDVFTFILMFGPVSGAHFNSDGFPRAPSMRAISPVSNRGIHRGYDLARSQMVQLLPGRRIACADCPRLRQGGQFAELRT
jgi:hypothetical protein